LNYAPEGFHDYRIERSLAEAALYDFYTSKKVFDGINGKISIDVCGSNDDKCYIAKRLDKQEAQKK